jgi:hypothetical protein
MVSYTMRLVHMVMVSYTMRWSTMVSIVTIVLHYGPWLRTALRGFCTLLHIIALLTTIMVSILYRFTGSFLGWLPGTWNSGIMDSY